MKYPEPSTYCYSTIVAPIKIWCSNKPTFKVSDDEWLCTYHARRKGYLPKKEPKYNRTEMEDQVVKDFVRILSFMREDLAVDIAREYLKGR